MQGLLRKIYKCCYEGYLATKERKSDKHETRAEM